MNTDDTIARFTPDHAVRYSTTPVGTRWECTCGFRVREFIPHQLALATGHTHVTDAALAKLIEATDPDDDPQPSHPCLFACPHPSHRTPTPSSVHSRCNCVPELGPEHCHVCGDDEGRPVAWAESHATPDVGVLAEVRAGLALALENSDWWYVRDAINMIDREAGR